MKDKVKCPVCGSATVLRLAKKGANIGEQFYVCDRYPECKGKVKYEIVDVEESRSKLKKLMGSIPSDIQWLATFECIRSQAAPVMGKVSKASSGGDDKEILEALNEATRQLPILLLAMKEFPEPSQDEYKKSREDVLKAIESYLQGCQLHIKWIETRNSLYLNEMLAHFNEATNKFDSSAKWLAKRD